MAIEKVRAYLAEHDMADRILEFEVSSATVELAAQAAGVEPERIAKTLSFHVSDRVALIVAAGDARIDNQKYKAQFHTKAKMLKAEEAEQLIGHAVGGVCPFAVNDGCDVFLDESLRRFDRLPRLRQREQRHRAHAERTRRALRTLYLGRRVQATGLARRAKRPHVKSPQGFLTLPSRASETTVLSWLFRSTSRVCQSHQADGGTHGCKHTACESDARQRKRRTHHAAEK